MKLLYKVLIGVGVAVVAVAAAGVGTLYGIWGKELNSISSIKEIIPAHESNKAGKVYEMTMDGGYYFDEFIEQGGVSNDDDLIQFIVDNITKGIIPISMKAPEVGCSSFTVTDENGNNLFGRNYDFASTSSLILHTNPGNGRHASISSVDLQFLGLGDGIDGLMDKLTAIAAAYAPLDGMNDAGVSCGIYMSYQGPGDLSYSTNQQTEKPDLTSTTMLRMILDYADDVDEAVELVKKYDLILPKKRNYIIETIASHYGHTHYPEHLEETRNIIRETCPDYEAAFEWVMRQRKGHMFNMFIMKEELFDQYCEWLFPILRQLEHRIDCSKYNAFQARYIGRISELLLNVWVHQNQIPYHEIPVISIEKVQWKKKIVSFVKAKYFDKKYENSF